MVSSSQKDSGTPKRTPLLLPIDSRSLLIDRKTAWKRYKYTLDMPRPITFDRPQETLKTAMNCIIEQISGGSMWGHGLSLLIDRIELFKRTLCHLDNSGPRDIKEAAI